jgi:hypothetical protein
MCERFYRNLCDRVSLDVSGSGGGPHSDSLFGVLRNSGFRDFQLLKNPGVDNKPLNIFENVSLTEWKGLLHLK